MRHGLLRCAVLLGVLAWSLTAQAQSYSYLGFRMLHGTDNPFRYSMDGRTPPQGLSTSQVEAALIAAWQTWQNQTCTSLHFRYDGRRTPTSQPFGDDPYDSINLNLIWLTDIFDPRFQLYLKDQPAAAVPVAYGGVLYRCDIFIDGYATWSTSNTPPTRFNELDLQSVLLREVGHCLGLGDTREDPRVTVMTRPVPPNLIRRQLSQHDIGQLCGYYPRPYEVGWACRSVADCREGLTCTPTMQGTGPADGGRFCTRACSSEGSNECPAPFTCQASEIVAGSYYACLPPKQGTATWVGRACQRDPSACQSVDGFCIAPQTRPLGNFLWQDGYCSQQCDTKACPAGSICVTSGPNKICLQSCQPGLGGCRDGYVCSPLAEGNACVSACYADADCGSLNDFTCRTCDRICLRRQNTTKTVGDTCNMDSECGNGQVCLRTMEGRLGVCSIRCKIDEVRTTCSCPNGTSCQPVGPGSSYMCVRDCTGPGSCSQFLQCSPLALGGRGCMPRCNSVSQCPGGSTCSPAGECVEVNSAPDGGSCVLCPDAGPPGDGGTDGGSGAVDGGTDGGTASPPPGGFVGCGCQGSSSAPLLLAALALWMLALRRSRWQRL
jgi:hypothetical protein